MGPSLWPHQRAAINAALNATASKQSGLWALPTGTGKTIGFTTFAKELDPERVLVLVHRDELIGQTLKAFQWVWPEASQGVIKGELDEWNRRMVVASIQSLHSKRLERYDQDLFDLVIADEAHHYSSESWGAALQYFQPRFTLGVTATPERLDGKGLDHLFGEEPLYVYPLRQAIEDGRLVRIKQRQIETRIDLDKVKVQGGDFQVGALSDAVNTPERNRIVVDAYLREAKGRRAAAFCVDTRHVSDLLDEFLSAGVTATQVTGTTPLDDRRHRLELFRRGEIEVMVNCNVLAEGFDDPGMSAILMARPTKSRGLYTQAIGRGLRLCEGKKDCLILDFTDNCRRHKLASVFSLLGARGEIEDASGEDVLDAVDEDNERLVREGAAADMRPLRWSSADVPPWPDIPALDGYTARFPWQDTQPSEKQLKFLAAFKLGIKREITKGEASYLINRCLEMEAKHPTPPTSKQEYFLRMRGVNASKMSKREASEMIGYLKGGGTVEGFDAWRIEKEKERRKERKKKNYWVSRASRKPTSGKRNKKIIEQLGLDPNPNSKIWGVGIEKGDPK
jgi:superfamily II DNA or RNA helicase